MGCFLSPSSSLLNKKAEEVGIDEIGSSEIQGLIDEMFAIAKGERSDIEKAVMVGLAAPQIGVSKRIILVDVGVDATRKNLGSLVAYINPEIVWLSKEREEGREGCFSVDNRVGGIVSRPFRIRIKAFDRHGKAITDELSGFTARIFQHELDHLNGIRFPERVGKEGILHWVETEEFPTYRLNWKVWQKKCPWDTWLAMKEGRPYAAPICLD